VAVQADPLRKSAHRIVVRIHLREGNVPEALRAYERFAQLLAQEVGVAPSTEMRRHVAPLLRPLTRYMLPANSVVLVP
jgi:DNA-binding SARP family transcriptional activator